MGVARFCLCVEYRGSVHMGYYKGSTDEDSVTIRVLHYRA